MAEKDNAFRRLLADKELFLRFLKRYLRSYMPEAILEMINRDELGPEDFILENDSLIPPNLREKRSDVIYRISYGTKTAYIYVLIEHQSRVDFLMPFRLLTYMVHLWDRVVAKAGDESRRKTFLLPPILPVVFYEGEAPWTAARNFTDKVQSSDELRGLIPDFQYRLISLRDEDPHKFLTGRDALGGLLYVAQPLKKETIFETAERLRAFLETLPEEEKILLGRHLGGYLQILAKQENLSEEIALDESFEGKGAEAVLTYLTKEVRRIRKEGREEGRKEGRTEGWTAGRTKGWMEGRTEGLNKGKLEMGISMAQAMLRNNEPEEKILRYTGFTAKQLAEIRAGLEGE